MWVDRSVLCADDRRRPSYLIKVTSFWQQKKGVLTAPVADAFRRYSPKNEKRLY